MLASELNDCGDVELMKIWNSGKNLMQKYNLFDYFDRKGQMVNRANFRLYLLHSFIIKNTPDFNIIEKY